ncbi:MAG: hypothetical protein U0003_02820 [Vampirovibrionales bacterium]
MRSRHWFQHGFSHCRNQTQKLRYNTHYGFCYKKALILGGLLRGLVIIALLIALIGGCFLVFPAAKELWQQTQGTHTADEALKAGDWTTARTQLEALTNQYPKDVTLGLKLATALQAEAEQLGKTQTPEAQSESAALQQKAAQRLLVLWQQFPNNITVGLAYGAFLAHDRIHHPNAVAVYRSLLQQKGTDPEWGPKILLATGQLFSQAAQFQPHSDLKHWLNQWASYYLQAAIAQQPHLFDARFQLALLHQQQANPAFTGAAVDASSIEYHSTQAARQYCNAALIKPHDIETRYNLGLSLVALNAIDEGFAQMKTAVDTLVATNQITRAQQVSEAMQLVKNGVFYQPDQPHTKAANKDSLLGQCLADPRLTQAANAQKEPVTASQSL